MVLRLVETRPHGEMDQWRPMKGGGRGLIRESRYFSVDELGGNRCAVEEWPTCG